MSDSVKPRHRIKAGSSAFTSDASTPTHDSFMNIVANVGSGTFNVAAAGSYGFNPLTRNRTLLEWCYRGSWLVRKVIDCPADDMTREGISIESEMPPDQIDEFTQYWTNLQIWHRINSALKWSRLYGGGLLVIMIEGQDTATPLRLDSIGQGQFKGLMVLDRWMVMPEYDLVKDFGADYGKPKYYKIVGDARTLTQMTVHHSRVIRFDGLELPYWQKMAENEWGLSVIEPLWDRLIAFDSATQGAAQLIYKAHLRVLKLPQFRELIASGGPLFQAVMKQLQMIRMMQTNEGMTVIDAADEFQVNQYSFGGLSDMMVQFAQQVSGAADVPMTRMFGQSPAGMNATGESDLRNYYDGLKSTQQFRLRAPVKTILDVSHRSLYGKPLPNGFNFSFKPLWQLTDEIKTGIATQTVQSVSALMQNSIFTLPMALKELRQSSRITGFGSNITDEDIEEAIANPPPPPGAEVPGEEPGVPGEQPGGQVQPGQPNPPPSGESPQEDDAPADGRPVVPLRGGSNNTRAAVSTLPATAARAKIARLVQTGNRRNGHLAGRARLYTHINAHGARINIGDQDMVSGETPSNGHDESPDALTE